MAEGKPSLSVIIPTYNEKGNMSLLIPRLCDILSKGSISFEILVMDDSSPDGTAAEVERISKDHPEARCIKREADHGLSPAVIEGFHLSRGEVLLVMDADLSHPPEVVPQMYRAIAHEGADIAVGSRHVKGGGIEEWPLHRRIISKGAAFMSRPLTRVSDPMSGFFAMRPDVIREAPLKAKGYKILLEILVKGRYGKLKEVPIVFKNREVGESKLGSRVILNYLVHLLQLYLHPGSAPLLKFLAVGGSGLIVDIGALSLLLLTFGDGMIEIRGNLHLRSFYLFQGASFIAALTWNFLWNRYWTFAASSGSGVAQYVKFFIVASAAFAMRSMLLYIGVDIMGVRGVPGYQILLFFVIVIVTAFNYLGSKLWAFK
ncbi:MAG: glycosyltransferase family 2 protein [Candidatus Thermoplasmatota archaeon]|nr:glycosyltransferase family 2 protein [Candidatus Thermoplasmatota archaeon]